MALGIRKKERVSYECGDTLDLVAQRRCGCPLTGSVQGRVGWVLSNLTSAPVSEGLDLDNI